MQIRRVVAATAAVTIAATSLVACSSDSDDSKTIKVGTTDDAKKAWVAFEQEAKNAGYDIDIQPFADYNTPNQALDQGELDTNNFQHLKFLAEYNHGNGTNLVPIVATEIVPLALFWKDHDSLDGIEGEEVAIPNDSTNQGRAINVLVQAGLPVLYAASRKRTIRAVDDTAVEAGDRLGGSLALALEAARLGQGVALVPEPVWVGVTLDAPEVH